VLSSEFSGDESWPVLVVESWSELLSMNLDELNLLYSEHALTKNEANAFGVSVLEKIFGEIHA
jgi:hypothetical protein